ncbi:hypothetical protein INQ51_02775 [Maribellus sp. CM-23]|uniref:hypothetical protein n=1 Tax=Maribellus sp. CM-23 TaxID=2781026 RepID=UPI001F337F3A|nr:hypothetical protein [Maribellus sp. CM-23]MCE4563224.1 hypothetical protein [Maribellus sp. CM-23]
MGRIAHKVYLSFMVFVTLLVFFALTFYGADYYLTPLHDRPVHPQHELLKPTGLIGHGIGMLGSAFMIIGVFTYMARKRLRRLSRFGVLRNWLEFHIFLCTLGPILVLFHTSFKFGGLVAVSFWSMVAVVLSGIIGRFIYLQIPRTIEGRELSLNELNSMESELIAGLKDKHQIDADIITSMNAAVAKAGEKEGVNYLLRIYRRFVFERKLVRQFRKELKTKSIKGKHLRSAVRIFKSKIILNRRIAWLSSMQNFLRYWHVAHLPFALVMLVIMIIHVIVAVLFGYKWIF